jgi:hypothetical protein
MVVVPSLTTLLVRKLSAVSTVSAVMLLPLVPVPDSVIICDPPAAETITALEVEVAFEVAVGFA